MGRFLTLCLFLYCSAFSYGQNFQFSPASPYSYVYKLDSAQTSLALKRQVFDTSYFFTHKLDSFKGTMPAYPPGVYLIASYLQNQYQLNLQLVSVPFAKVQTIAFNDLVQVRLLDSSFNQVENSEFWVDQKKQKFDSSCACFEFDRSKKNRTFFLKKGNDFMMGYIEGGAKVYAEPTPSNYNYTPPVSYGYMLVNQPKYHTGDSVKLKAYILKPDRQPKTRILDLYLICPNPYKEVLIARVAPGTKGAYYYQFKLMDTLKIDEQYGLEFKDENNTTLQSCNFRIEDYKLRNASYEAQMEKTQIYAGEPVKFFLKATDANGLPLQDARARLRLKLSNYSNFTGTYLFVPDVWKENMYETQVVLDISNATEITVPSGIFPPLDLYLEAEISFSDPSGELKQITIPFSVFQQQDYYTLNLEEGRIKAHYMKLGKSTPKKAVLLGYLENRIITRDTVMLPLQKLINPNCERYYLLDTSGKTIQTLALAYQHQTLWIDGIRTHDSIKIQLQNPSEFKVHYRIYRNDKLVHSAYGNTLNYCKVDTSNYSYNIIYSYLYRGNQVLEERIFSFKDKELEVKTNMPSLIYPGEKVALDILVLNPQREPQPNVNLTAFGVNAQFEDYLDPQLAYYGTDKNAILIRENSMLRIWPQYASYTFYMPSYTTLLKAGIITQGDYRLRYPNELLLNVRTRMPYGGISFTPFVTGNGKRIEIYMMELDSNPVYVKGISQMGMPFSFRISAGKHTISMRTATAWYHLTSQFEGDSSRYVISFDTLCLPAGISKQISENKQRFSKSEYQRIKAHTLLINTRNLNNLGQVYFIQEFQQMGLEKPLHYWYDSELKRTNSYFGLFAYGNIEVYANGKLYQKFRFEPNKRYDYFREKFVAEDVDSIDLPYEFSYFRFSDASFNTLYDSLPQLITPVPMTQNLPKMQESSERNTLKEECYFPYLFMPEEDEKATKTRVQIMGMNLAQCKGFFLYHKQSESKSVLKPDITYENEILYNLDTGSYDMYFVSGRNAVMRLLNAQVPAGGIVLIRLDTLQFTLPCSTLNPLRVKSKDMQVAYENRVSVSITYRKEDYVKVREKVPLQISVSTDKMGMLSGAISNSYGEALENVIVTLEKSGKVMGISFTDVTGSFLMRDIASGTYQLRLTRFGSCVTLINEVDIKSRTMHSLSIQLQDCGFAEVDGVITPSIYFGKSQISKADIESMNETAEPFVPGTGIIKGSLVDAQNKRPLDFVTLELSKNGVVVLRKLSEDDGSFLFKNLSPGTYSLKASFIGYKTTFIEGIEVKQGEIRSINFSMMQNGTNLQEVMVVERGEGYGADAPMILSAPTRNLNSIAGTTMGVESRVSYDLAVRGSRADGTAYYIDGVRVNSGAVGLPSNAIDQVSINVGGLPAQNGDADFELGQKRRMYKMLENPQVKELRQVFRDHAFWVPNLVTDKYGEAHVSITFPDNITRWRTFVLAMNTELNTKVYAQDVRSYKPLSARLYIPSYLILGDKFYMRGSISNYTGDSLKIRTRFSLKDSTLKQSDQKVKTAFKETYLFGSNRMDTLQLGYELETDFKYKDAEKFYLPVLSNGVAVKDFDYYRLQADTGISFTTDSKGTFNLSIMNSYSQLLREEIKRLQNYQYGCVEQTTSKLSALLTEMKLCKILGDSFEHRELVNTCIRRLNNLQQSNGSWGWYSYSESEMWLTHYVLKTLQQAAQMGFNAKAIKQGVGFMRKSLVHVSYSDRIKALDVLFDAREELDYAKYLEPIDEGALNDYDRLMLTALKQKIGMDHFSGFLFVGIQKKADGSIYWNAQVPGIYRNNTCISLMAYEVLKKDGADSALLAGIRKYFFNDVVFGSGWSRNTLESAKILQAMATDIAAGDAFTLQTRVSLNGEDLGTHFPIKKKLEPGKTYTLHKSGAEARVFVMHQYTDTNPKVKATQFEAKGSFMQDGKPCDTISSLLPVYYMVNLDVKQNAEFIMVQIPIPAACVYMNKNERYGADEAEYHKDRIILYYRKLKMGKRSINIQLEPRFAGEFTLLPVQVENMYDPEISGNSEVRKVIIK